MELFLNLETRTATTGVGSNTLIRSLKLARGTVTVIELTTYRANSTESVGVGAVMILGIKKQKDFSGSYLAQCTMWQRSGSAWTGMLDLRGQFLLDELGNRESLPAVLEITYKTSEEDITFDPIPFQITNDYNKGDEEIISKKENVSIPRMVINATLAGANDFTMFPENVPPVEGFWMQPDVNGIWIFVGGWSQWRFINAGIPE